MNYIYQFDADCTDPQILGNKGANLIQMVKLGINVPEGFIISTKVHNFYKIHNQLPDKFIEQINGALELLEKKTNSDFLSEKNTLLVSVRSGAPISMPGMMDTILNVGLTNKLISKIQKSDAIKSSSAGSKFLFETYKRFISSYNHSISKLPIKEMNSLSELIDFAEQHIPQTPAEQVIKSIFAVWDSWNSKKALVYRKNNNISDEISTACVIQRMVFGNKNESSGTGVVFTRNPINGTKELYGEFLVCAQGEDVVSGKCTPHAIQKLTIDPDNEQLIDLIEKPKLKQTDLQVSDYNHKSFQELFPTAFLKLISICGILEKHYSHTQDIEFTIEDENLYILQTRNANCSPKAYIKNLIDFAEEGLISNNQILNLLKPEIINKLLHPIIRNKDKLTEIAVGLPASPGGAQGFLAFSSQDVKNAHKKMQKVILVRKETNPEDIGEIYLAEGILTSSGGTTSHAAVVTRTIGKPCVCGTPNILIDEKNKVLIIGNRILSTLDNIIIDGTTGQVFVGQADIDNQSLMQSKQMKIFCDWFDKIFNLQIQRKDIINKSRLSSVRANAETADDLKISLFFGADGIGLCRTEHMLFQEEPLMLIRRIILFDENEKLLTLREHYINNFSELYALLNGKPINIRLLDAPLHEFIPDKIEDQQEFAKNIGIDFTQVINKISALKETNPMLGHRGIRMGITNSKLYKMQIEAIFIAAIKQGLDVVEIMLPMVSELQEVIIIRNLINQVADCLFEQYKIKISYKLGCMIELARAAIIADELASICDYLSFGTNDLTQSVYGISRDDAKQFLPYYKEEKIFTFDPFTKLDQKGVGSIMKLAVEKARFVKPHINISVCGEQAADSESIKFLSALGIDYISCSPYKILAAKIAIAQTHQFKS